MNHQHKSEITAQIEPGQAVADFSDWPLVTFVAPEHVDAEHLKEALDELICLLRMREGFCVLVDLSAMTNASLEHVKLLTEFAKEYDEELRDHLRAVAFVEPPSQARSLGRIVSAIYEPHFPYAICCSQADAAGYLRAELMILEPRAQDSFTAGASMRAPIEHSSRPADDSGRWV